MVDFDNEATIGTPAADVERISILQRRYDLFEALEDYKKKRLGGAGVSLSIVRARLFSLFLELQAMLKRRWNKKEYTDLLYRCLESDTEEEILNIIFTLNEELDSIRLTRIDMKKVYDSSKVEAENKAQGF